MLARHHESVAPIAEVSAPGPIGGRTTTGALLIPLPVDYIAWTQVVARHAEHKELLARHWKINEAFSIAAER
jgi:hypothetical protein